MKLPNCKPIFWFMAIWVCIILWFGVYLLGIQFGKYYASLETCAYCEEKIFGEEIEVRYEPKRWVCEECWAKLDLMTWGDGARSGEKMKEVNRLIDGRLY